MLKSAEKSKFTKLKAHYFVTEKQTKSILNFEIKSYIVSYIIYNYCSSGISIVHGSQGPILEKMKTLIKNF